MLPWDKTRGRKAYKNLRVYINIPEEFNGKTFEQIKVANAKRRTKYITLGEISLSIGGKKVW